MSPDCLLEVTDGSTPKLSVAVGLCQSTLSDVVGASSIAMSLGQYVNTGGCSSTIEVKLYDICDEQIAGKNSI